MNEYAEDESKDFFEELKWTVNIQQSAHTFDANQNSSFHHDV